MKFEMIKEMLRNDGINSSLIDKMSNSELITAASIPDYYDYIDYMDKLARKYDI